MVTRIATHIHLLKDNQAPCTFRFRAKIQILIVGPVDVKNLKRKPLATIVVRTAAMPHQIHAVQPAVMLHQILAVHMAAI